MRQDSLVLGIPAYTTFRGGGLMHFLFQAIPALANVRPNWTFNIAGSIALPEIQQLAGGIVQVHFWDDDLQTRVISRVGSQALKWLGKGSDAGFLLQKRAEMYGLPWGRAENRLALLHASDVLWVPHYNISLDRISLFNDLAQWKAPVLLTIHDIHPAFFPEDHAPDDLARFYQGFVPFAKTCRRIITHSQAQKSAIACHLQLPAEKITVTPQPPLIDPESLLRAYHPARSAQTLSQFGIHRPYAFYAASTTHVHKNHIRLLAAWVQLKKELGENCPLLVCTGKGNRRQYQRLLSLVAAFGLQQDVLFTGSIDTPNLAALYQNCALVVVPTIYEGAGSGILTDALVTGKPVACADIPHIREQLAALGPVEVTLFDPYNISAIASAVLAIWRDLEDQQRKALQNQSLTHNVFPKMWQTWAEAYAECIEDLLAV